MNRDDIIKWAREAGFTLFDEPNHLTECQMLDHFAALVAAEAAKAEREACAKVAEDSDHVVGGRGYYDQLGDADATVRNIVAAIRARGNT